MANTIGSIVVEMAADIAGFKGSLSQAVKATNDAVDKIKAGFELIGVGLSAAALVDFTKSTIEFGNQLYLAATKANINAQALSELAFAARSSGVGLEELSGSLAKMQKAVSSAGSGVGKANVTLSALGLTFSELNKLTPDEQFTVFAQKISELQSPADKTRAAMELFGRSGADLLPLFSQGAEGIAKARIEAGLLGQSLGADTVESLHKTKEAMDRVTESLKGLGTAIVVAAAPAATSIFDHLTASISGNSFNAAGNKIKVLTQEINDYTEAMSHKGEWSLEGIIGSGFSDRNLLSLQTQLNTLLLIQQTERDLKNQNLKGLGTTPTGYGDITEIKINPNWKIREDSLKKFFEDLDKATQTGAEKVQDDLARFQAQTDVLMNEGRFVLGDTVSDYTARLATGSRVILEGQITMADALNRLRAPADTKALSDFFANNKASIDSSIGGTTNSVKTSFAAQAEAAKRAGEVMRAEFERTRQFADSVSGAISNTFAQAFLNIGKGGLRGLLADFTKAFAQIVAQAESVNLTKALGLGPSSLGGSSILSTLAGWFTGNSGTGITNGAGSQDVPRFATGGSFNVGGTGGTDSQLVSFKATPGERVTVSTPGQGGGVTVINNNYIDSRTDSTQIAQLIQASTQRAVQQSKSEMTQLIKRGAFA